MNGLPTCLVPVALSALLGCNASTSTPGQLPGQSPSNRGAVAVETGRDERNAAGSSAATATLDAGAVGTLVDVGGSAECPQRARSTLPGVSLRVISTKCRYSLDEVSQPLVTPYELRFERAVRAVKPFALSDELLVPWPAFAYRYKRGCGRPKDASNLMPAAWILGGTRSHFCYCDQGECDPIALAPKDVLPGSFRYEFHWIGKNMMGSSDTHNQPEGTFEVGNYELTVRTDGSYLPEGASERQPFHLETIFPITITP